MSIAHVTVYPASPECTDLVVHDFNVLALPLAGIFAKHDGPDRHTLASANHAIFIPAGSPYRLSFPGSVGDRCLTFRFSGATLSKLMPQAVSRDSINIDVFASSSLIPASIMLTPHLLWQKFQQKKLDPLELEESAVALLVSALDGARQTPQRSATHKAGRSSSRTRQLIETIKEAISLAPERKWTLSNLAELVCLSPYHLAHVFRREVGTSVYQYLLRSRLALALGRVIDDRADLATVALDSGFSSHSHFSACFGAFFGLTPTELRRGASSKKIDELRKILTAQRLTSV